MHVSILHAFEAKKLNLIQNELPAKMTELVIEASKTGFLKNSQNSRELAKLYQYLLQIKLEHKSGFGEQPFPKKPKPPTVGQL